MKSNCYLPGYIPSKLIMQLDHVLIKVTVKCWPTPGKKIEGRDFFYKATTGMKGSPKTLTTRKINGQINKQIIPFQ